MILVSRYLTIILITLAPHFTFSLHLKCKDILNTSYSSTPKISWKALTAIEAFEEDYFGFGEWVSGWPKKPDIPLRYARGYFLGEKVFLKRLSAVHPQEISNLEDINQFDIAPKLLGKFRKYHSDWMIIEFLEGEIFRLDYVEPLSKRAGVGPTKDGTGYIPHWQNNYLIGKVNENTIRSVKKIFTTLNTMSLAAHDFQFIVLEDGDIRLIDLGMYEYTPNAKIINQRIMSIVVLNLNMLMNGIKMPAPSINDR